MALLTTKSIMVVHPPRLSGDACLVVDRYATFATSGLTDAGHLLQVAKSRAGVDTRRRAAEELWDLVSDVAECIPANHPARQAVGVVHVPLSKSNRFAVSAVACGIAEALGIEVHSNTLTKPVAGPKMQGAPPAVKAQMQGAFVARNVPEGLLLVVDDLVESGATLAAAGEALRTAGADEIVYIAAVVLD